MESLSYKTQYANKATVNKQWVLIDAQAAIVGRVSTKIASMLRGKHKTNFTPNVDCGDNVIVINASKVRFTGNKMSDKQYVRHTGHPGGQRFATPKELLQKRPNRVIEHAVKGMLPKNRLGRELFTNMNVYEGAEHPHSAQNPQLITL